MFTAKRIAYACTVLALCAMISGGCSEERGRKQENKAETRQERIGREAAQNLQKPMKDARQAAQLGTERVQMLSDTAQETKSALQEEGTTPEQASGREKK